MVPVPSAAEDAPKASAGKQFVDVVVFTTDAGELGRALQNVPHIGAIGTASGGGFSTPRIQVPEYSLELIRSLPSTLGVYDYETPEKHMDSEILPMSGGSSDPTNVDAVYNHNAPAAWARGFMGQGVTIAVVDDGVDFAHPDLMGTTARYNVSSIPSATLDASPWLETYDGWPESYDPTSMSAYFASGGKAEGNWYANTTSTNDTVWHTVKVDGKNDFWTDGSEKVGTDSNSDIVEINGTESRLDYNLVDLWVTQDLNNWYFGFTSKSNHSTLNFGLYINTTSSAPWTNGATIDPLGNYITTIGNHSPEFAVYMTHIGGQPAGKWDRNDTIDNATVWKWEQSSSSWGSPVNVTDQPIGGQFGYGKYDFRKGEGWVEFSIPKNYLGNPPAISLELFTTGTNLSHAQDTCYEDPSVAFSNPDWSSSPTQLTAFTEVTRTYWHHTRNKVGDRAMFSWPIHYITTDTSKSGTYFFGDHPDENLPQTRILVVDESVAGVYDTVYVDLDHNKDFHNDKPLKKLGKYDDATKTWHAVDWIGQGAVYDETSYMDFYDPGGAVRALNFSMNGRWLASGGEDHQVIVWDTTNWAVKWVTNPQDGRPVSLAFSPNSSWLAGGFDDASGGRYWVLVWDVATGQVVRTFKGHTASVNALSWSKDGMRLASASSDKTAIVWSIAGATEEILAGHTKAVTGVSWRWFDNTIATSSYDGTICMWKKIGAAWQCQTRFPYGSPLTSIDFSPSGSLIATSSTDWNVTIWEASTGLSVNYLFLAHLFNPVMSVRWDSTGTRLVSSSNLTIDGDPTVVVWDVPTVWQNFYPNATGFGACFEGSRGYRSPVAVFAHNGTQVAGGCGNSPIRLWDTSLALQGVLRGHRIGITDYTRWDAGDGLPDISGGMIYFIAQNYYYPQTRSWGTPIPYSPAYANRNGQATLYIPANGTLVAFTGALDLNMKHGTLTASSIVGRGMSRYYDSTSTLPFPMRDPTSPQVVGIAPAAKILSVGNIYTSSVFEAWWFTAQGYDGAPMSGDEPQIASNSFGVASTYEDGWDFYSRFTDWITMVYAQGKLVFTASSGDYGNGYGTMTAPASAAGVITVGASTDFYYRRHSGLEGTMSPSYGDVVPFSGRGPTVLGVPDPDILANGRMSFGSTPLNQFMPYNGQLACELWSGTSLSSSLAAGILAMTMQAYRGKYGSWPNATTSKSLLMSSSDDINYDVYSQGTGILNADRATKLAAGLEGFLVTPSLWTPGNYSGKKYEAFTSLMTPGSSETETFTVANVDPAKTRTANLSSEIFYKFAQTDFGVTTTVDPSNNARDSWLVITGTSPVVTAGAYELLPISNILVRRASVSREDWISADLTRITMYANFTSLDGDHDGVLGGSKDFTYDLDIYDWTWDGTASEKYPHTGTFRDLNRMTINHPTANIVQATIHNPAIRTHDGLVIGVRRFPYGAAGIYFRITIEYFNRTSWAPFLTLSTNSLSILPGSSSSFDATVDVPSDIPVGSYEGAIYVKGNPQRKVKNWELQIAGTRYLPLGNFNVQSALVYRWVGATWRKLVEGTDYVVRRDAGVLNFTRLVPALGAGDLVKADYWYDQVVTIPVSVTVPANGVIFNWTGGKVAGQDEMYTNMVSSGFGLGGPSGDWRFYPTILPEGGLYDLSTSMRFLAKVGWELKDTDIDVFGFGAGGTVIPVGSDLSTSRYGPFLVGKNNGGSTVTSLAFTTTGSNMEIASPDLAGGLNIIAIHVVHMNGTKMSEKEWGQMGLFNINPTEITVVTNKLYGQRSLQMYSSMGWNGLGAVSAGPAPAQRYMNEHIKQDSTEGTDFVAILAKGSYTRQVNIVPSALIFSVNISSDQSYTDRPCPDLDLGIFLDGKGPGNKPDGISQPDEFVVYSAGSTATESVRLIRPTVEDDPDTPTINELVVGSPYLIKVLGYSVPWAPYGTFNMDVTLVQGAGFSVEGTSSWDVWPYNISKVVLKWDLPGSTKPGKLLGALYLGPANAPLMILVPVTLIIDFTPPRISKFSVTASGEKLVDASTGRVTNDPRPSFVVEVIDDDRGELDQTAVRTYLDGENVTTWTTVSYAYTAHPTSAVQGKWTGSVRFVPLAPLSDGPHQFKVRVADAAGNQVERDWIVVIDSKAPFMALDGPTTVYTNSSQYVVSGTTVPGTYISVQNLSVIVGPSGSFFFVVPLTPGENKFVVKATDWFSLSSSGNLISGNFAETEITVVSDPIPPTLQVSVSPALTTDQDSIKLYGQVNDTAPGMELRAETLTVVVNGLRVPLQADGYFTVWLSLPNTGPNMLHITVTDLAGNSVSEDVVVTKDNEPPSLVLDSMPGIVTADTVNVTGKTTPGSRVKVNGFDATVDSNGNFYRVVQLSAGMNMIVVRSSDVPVGNTVETRFGVYYASTFAPETGSSGGYLGIHPAAWAVILIILGIIIGIILFFLMKIIPWPLFGKPKEGEGARPKKIKREGKKAPEEIIAEEAGEEEIAEAEKREEEVETEELKEPVPAEPEMLPIAPAAPAEDPKVAKLKKLYEEGKISEEVYQENLKRLKGAS